MSKEEENNLNKKIAKHEKISKKNKGGNVKSHKEKSSKDNGKENYKYLNEFENANSNKKTKKILKIVISILLVILIIFGVIFGRYLYKSGGSITGAVMNMVKDVLGDQDPIFVLVMGVSEDISVELTDTIMLVGYNPDNNQTFVLSIPRDTFIGTNEATAGGFDKINALYQKDPEKTVEAVEKLTGVNIDYYVTVKTSALVEIVDAIGGVEFDVPIDMDYDDSSQDLHIHLKAGTQTLNGDQAEQLVRFRHNNNGSTYSADYGDNDEGRMRTQREFLKVTASQVISWNNVDKIKEIATTVFNNLDTDMPLSKILTYIPYAATVDVENDLSMDQLPGTPEMINELWFYRANTSETQELINSYVEKMSLSSEEKSKYITTIKTTTTKTTKNTTSTTNTTNTTTNTNSVNNTANNTVKNTNSVENTNTTKNAVNTNNTVNNTTKNEVANNTVTSNQNSVNNSTVENVVKENSNESSSNTITNSEEKKENEVE